MALEFFRRKKQDQPEGPNEFTDPNKPRSRYAGAVVEAYERQFGSETTESRSRMVREIAESFFLETLNNAQLHESQKHGAKYPCGVIDTGALTKKIYEHVSGQKLGALKEPEHQLRGRKKFILGSLLFRMHGTPFMYQEAALHELTKTLQTGIEAIERGEEPSSTKVYTLGSPTNFLGKMSPQFLDEIRDQGAFEAFASLYAEHISEILAEDKDVNTPVEIHGISLGAALAAETGRQLLENKNVTQKEGEVGKPHLHVLMETAPASSHTPAGLKAVQTAVGFGIDSAFATKRDPYINAAWNIEGKFVEDINILLAQRGIPSEMSPEQTGMKQKGLRSLVAALLKGRPIPKDMKVTETVGLYDPLLFSPLFEAKAAYQRATRDNSLQRYLVAKEGDEGGRKRYGIAMAHVPPFYRKNELDRLNRAAMHLERIGARTKGSQETP